MTGIIIPVVFLDDQGPTEDRVGGRPCVPLRFTWELSSKGQYNPWAVKQTYGMIDTGCDFVAIEEGFVGHLPQTASKQLLVSTPNGTIVSNVYRCTLLLGSSDVMAHETDIVVIPNSKHPYKVYLGRTFLQFARFNYDGPRGVESVTMFPH